MPFDSSQERILKRLHLACVGGMNEGIAEASSKVGVNSTCPWLHSGSFPDIVGVKIGRCDCSLVKSCLYNY